MGREKKVSLQRRRVCREEQRKARRFRFRGLRHERRCFHRRRTRRVAVLKKGAPLTDAARGVCGEHAWASPGGKQREQAPALHDGAPSGIGSSFVYCVAPGHSNRLCESYCHPIGRVLHLRFRTSKAPKVPGNRAGFERLNPRFGVKGRGERCAQPRTVRVQTGLFLKQIEAGARFST